MSKITGTLNRVTDTQFTFTPTTDLEVNSKYRLVVDSSFKSSTGFYIDKETHVTFDTTTGIPEDPYIEITYPGSGAILSINSTIQITWLDNISENVKIELYDGDGFVGELVASVSGNSWAWIIDDSYSESPNYYLKVSSIIDPLIFDTTGTFSILWFTCEVPVAIDATSITSTSFQANWLTSIGASGYYLDIATDINFISFVSGYENLDVGDVLLKSVVGLTENTTYFYRLRAYNTLFTSANSNIIYTHTLTTPTIPPIPTDCDCYHFDSTDDYLILEGLDTVITGVGGYFDFSCWYNERGVYTRKYLASISCGSNTGTSPPDPSLIVIYAKTGETFNDRIEVNIAGSIYRGVMPQRDSFWHYLRVRILAGSVKGSFVDGNGKTHITYNITPTVYIDNVAVVMSAGTHYLSLCNQYDWLIGRSPNSTTEVLSGSMNMDIKDIKFNVHNAAGVITKDLYVPCTEEPVDPTSNDIILTNFTTDSTVTINGKNMGTNYLTFYKADI